MVDWVLVPCLVSLRDEFDALAPDRSKASDGSIGDAAHAGSSSDHNPDETGRTPYEDADNINEVHAIDVDARLRRTGWTMTRCTNLIVDRHRQGLDDRLQNVIFNRFIASASWGWTWRPYTGKSPHTEHAHFSAKYITSREADRSPWGLLEAEENTVRDEDITKIAEAVAAQLLDKEPIIDRNDPGKRTLPLRKFVEYTEVYVTRIERAIGSLAGDVRALAETLRK